MNLDEIVGEMQAAHARGDDVARVHSGDPSLYGAIGEQMRRLDALEIPYDITPGVPAFAAAAATLQTELTLPDVSQTVILTRTAMKSSAMPNAEDLATLGASGATLAIHLSVRNIRHVVETLTPHYGADCPVAVVVRASWPDEEVVTRHARHHRRQGARGEDHAHRAHPGGPRSRPRRFRRLRALRPGPPAPLPQPEDGTPRALGLNRTEVISPSARYGSCWMSCHNAAAGATTGR